MEHLSLEELKARAVVHADSFALWQRHAVEKAVTRLAQAQDASANRFLNSPCAAADLLARHAALAADLSRSAQGDERSMLRRLLALPALPADVAGRIGRGAATLADALTCLELRPDLAKEGGRIRGAVERFAEKVTGQPASGPAHILARLPAIDARLATLSHADFALDPGSWSSFCSRVRRAARLVDATEGRMLKASQLAGPWAPLVGQIEKQAGKGKAKSQRSAAERTVAGYLAKLWPLLAFCHRQGIAPNAVDDGVIRRFQLDSAVNEISDPFTMARVAVYAWEALQKRVPGFPPQTLTRLYRDGHARTGRLPFDRLPCSLQADWMEFVARHERKPVADLSSLVVEPQDALPSLGKAHRATGTLAPKRLPHLRSAVTLAANAAIGLGVTPERLADVVRPTVAKRALQELLARQRQKDPNRPDKNNPMKGLATNLLKVARLIGIDADDERALVGLRDDVDPYLIEIRTSKDGKEKRIYSDDRMGPRHRERLEQFADPIKLHAWFQMLPTLATRMQSAIAGGRTPNQEDTNDGIAGALHALTQSCPVRTGNLAQITIAGPDPWLRLPSLRGDRARMTIPAQYVKNRKQIDVELTPEATGVVRAFVTAFLPALKRKVGADDNNPYLFPAEGGKHRSGEALNSVFTDRNWKIGGIELNIQCQRHLCGKIILDEDPTRMVLVQLLLDHKNITSTQRYYTQINKLLALREFHALVEKRRQALHELMAGQKRMPTRGGPGSGRSK
jgi:hypothetical protein